MTDLEAQAIAFRRVMAELILRGEPWWGDLENIRIALRASNDPKIVQEALDGS